MKYIFFTIMLWAISLQGICQNNNRKNLDDSAAIARVQADSLQMMDSLLKYMDTNTIRNDINKIDSLLKDSVYKAYTKAYSDSLNQNGNSSTPSADSTLMAAFKKAMNTMDSAYKGVNPSTLDSLSKLPDDSIYNKHKQLTMLKFNGIDKLLGLSYEKFEYNRRGDMIRSAYYNDNDEIKPGFAGIAITVCKYDKRHNCIEERFLDEHKKLMNDNVFGVAVVRNSYNKQNQLLESDYWDNDGKPVSTYAKTIYQYNSHGTLLNSVNYDAKGNMVR